MLKKFLIIFLAFSFIFLIILGGGLLRRDKKEGLNSGSNGDVCGFIANENLEKTCQAMKLGDSNICNSLGEYDALCFEFILKSIEVSKDYCDEIKGVYGKTICFRNLAIQERDLDLCVENDDCFTQRLEIASLTSNEELCDFFSDTFYKYLCLAKSNKNKNYCKEIGNDFMVKDCLSYFPEDLSDCEVENNRKKCLYKLALEKQDTDICNLVESNSGKIECFLNIKNDLEICMKESGDMKDICVIYYLKNQLKMESGRFDEI